MTMIRTFRRPPMTSIASDSRSGSSESSVRQMGSKTSATSTEETLFTEFANSLFVNFQFVLFIWQLEKVKGPEQWVFCCKKSTRTKSSRHEIPPPLPSQQQFKKFKVGTKILPYFSLFSHFAHNLKTVLRIRIQDPVPFWPLDPGSGIGFSRIPYPKPICLRAQWKFFGKKFNNSLKIGPNSFFSISKIK